MQSVPNTSISSFSMEFDKITVAQASCFPFKLQTMFNQKVCFIHLWGQITIIPKPEWSGHFGVDSPYGVGWSADRYKRTCNFLTLINGRKSMDFTSVKFHPKCIYIYYICDIYIYIIYQKTPFYNRARLDRNAMKSLATAPCELTDPSLVARDHLEGRTIPTRAVRC